MKAGYDEVHDPAEVTARIGRLAAQTVIFDIEPLIAVWDTSQETLDRGLRLVTEQLTAVSSVRVVCFATNSDRLPSALPELTGVRVEYRAQAFKPVRTASYRGLPYPGVVVGDQILTDGLLARRLGYTFLHYRPRPGGTPFGPRLLSGFGELLRPLLFSRVADRGRPGGRNAAGGGWR
jgi:predicted HAD superfamily phosphohydrolase YqeG